MYLEYYNYLKVNKGITFDQFLEEDKELTTYLVEYYKIELKIQNEQSKQNRNSSNS